MINEKYGLYFEGINNSGKKEKYLIYEGSIDKIDMYTCFCSDAKSLYECLPKGDKTYYSSSFNCNRKTPNVKGYIDDNFSNDFTTYDKENDKYIDNHFYIKRVTGKGLKEKFPILFWKDRDVVYINRDPKHLSDNRLQTEIYNKLCELSLTIPEFNTAVHLIISDSAHTNGEKKLCIRYKFFQKIYNEVEKRNTTLVNSFDDNAEEHTRNVVSNLATNHENLRSLSVEVTKDLMLRRKLAMQIKDTLKIMDDVDNKKTRMLSKEVANARHENREKYYFSLGKIYDGMHELLNIKEAKKDKKEEKLEQEKEVKVSSRPDHEDPDIWNKAIDLWNNEDAKYSGDEPFLGPAFEGDPRYKRY